MRLKSDVVTPQLPIPPRQAHTPGMWILEARRLITEARYAEAMLAIEHALALAPQNLSAKSLRKAILTQINNMPQALAVLELASALEPDSPKAHLDLAYAHVNYGHTQTAERHFKWALALAPESVEAHAALSALYIRTGQDEDAQRHALLALEAEPNHIVACQTMSELLEKQGQSAESEAYLDRAYSAQSLFFEPATDSSRLTVLVLATRTQGNIPYRHLMSPQHYSRHVWYMEHATAEQGASLPPHDLVFNSIGDPDVASGALAQLSAFAGTSRMPVFNLPGRVTETRRHRLPDTLSPIAGILVPKTVKLNLGNTQARDILSHEGFTLPVLVRPIGSHGGKGLQKIDTPEQFDAFVAEFAGKDVYITQYIDYRAPDGFFRKGRMIFVNRRPLPYHWAISPDWMVHYDSAGMDDDPIRQGEERIFLDTPAATIGDPAMAALTRIGQTLDLDYCGIDFSILPDGRVLVFEANPTMLVHPEPENGTRAFKNAAVDAIIQAFQAHLAHVAKPKGLASLPTLSA